MKIKIPSIVPTKYSYGAITKRIILQLLVTSVIIYVVIQFSLFRVPADVVATEKPIDIVTTEKVEKIPENDLPHTHTDTVTAENLEKIPLYLITPSSRPSLLVKGIFHVLPLHEYFDVTWIIVHNTPDQRISKAPLFRNVFPWITEIFSFDVQSISGNHERNVGIQHVLDHASSGLVYFLDDDNTLPIELCQEQKKLSVDKMYYADQHHCGANRLNMDWMKDEIHCTNGKCPHVELLLKADTGTFLTPVWLLKEHRVQWKLDEYTADAIFFTDIVNFLLQLDGNMHRLEQIPSFYFNYNELNDANGCLQWRAPWSADQLHESLQLYRNVVTEMTTVQQLLPTEQRMKRSEVSFHNYVHILHVLRNFVTTSSATYVEIGVWKGGTSILMSRHPMETNVVGIDVFFFDHQLEEAEQYREHLHGNGTIQFIKSDSKLAIPELQMHLKGKEIDILFIDGDHSVEGTRKDYELYAPLVAKGGFIVFDDFLDTGYSGGVRVAVMELIRDGEINMEKYNIIGSVENIVGAGPIWVDDNFFYDWQKTSSNEFVMQKQVL